MLFRSRAYVMLLLSEILLSGDVGAFCMLTDYDFICEGIVGHVNYATWKVSDAFLVVLF